MPFTGWTVSLSSCGGCREWTRPWITFHLQEVWVVHLVFILVTIWWTEHTRPLAEDGVLLGLGVVFELVEHASDAEAGSFANQNAFLLLWIWWFRRIRSTFGFTVVGTLKKQNIIMCGNCTLSLHKMCLCCGDFYQYQGVVACRRSKCMALTRCAWLVLMQLHKLLQEASIIYKLVWVGPKARKTKTIRRVNVLDNALIINRLLS